MSVEVTYSIGEEYVDIAKVFVRTDIKLCTERPFCGLE